MTFYLKYRPQKISELDLVGVRSQLEKIITSKNIPHAFLFSGPRGAGKTSTARILAKVINCENPKNGEPCNKCTQCLAITQGNSLDVIEIDAASHRGVDDIRALRETIKLVPIASKMKVYIIDEAHMLTTEAANALLKTLEEPPLHAMFILATTAPEKLPETIISRCTKVAFYKGNKEEVRSALKRAVEGEKIEISDGALDEIAAHVDGGLREAHKVLEQLSLGREKIVKEDVFESLNMSSVSAIPLLELLDQKNATKALKEIDEVVKKGVNLKIYTTDVISVLRKSILKNLGVLDEEQLWNRSQSETLLLIELLTEAIRQYPTTVVAQLPLEIAVVKWCGEAGGTSAGDLHADLRSDSNPLSPSSDNREQHSTKTTSPGVVSALTEKELEEKWGEFLRKTNEKNFSVGALLRATKPLAFDGLTFQLEVFYKFHKDKLENDIYRSVVEQVGNEVFGSPVRLNCILSTSKKRAVDIANITTPEDQDLAKAAEQIFVTEEKLPN